MYFEIIGDIIRIERIAAGSSLRERGRLIKKYGRGRWRKMKGVANVRLERHGIITSVEIHWYEAHGIGRKEFKIKRLLP